MAYPFPNLNCLLAQIWAVPEHGTECTRGNSERFSLVSNPSYPVCVGNRSRDFGVVPSLEKHGSSLDQSGWTQEMFSSSLLGNVSRGWQCSPAWVEPIWTEPIWTLTPFVSVKKDTLATVQCCCSHRQPLYCPSPPRASARRYSRPKQSKCWRFLRWCEWVEHRQQNKSVLKARPVLG